MGNGITFDDKYHTYKDWGLKLLSVRIPSPDVQENTIDVPGMDGSLDLTEALGRILYSDRDGIELVFDLLDGSYANWFTTVEKIAGILHGRKVKMILDDEPNRFYNIRLHIDTEKSNAIMSQIILSGKAEPFKYDVTSTLDKWEWDNFNFVNGVIQQHDNIIVESSLTVLLIGKGKGSNPTFIVDEADSLEVTYKENTFALNVGKNRITDIYIGNGEIAELMFSGTGTLAIDYRGEYI